MYPDNSFIKTNPYKVGYVTTYAPMCYSQDGTLTGYTPTATFTVPSDAVAVDLTGTTGTVTKVSGLIDPATGSVSMIARFPNPDHLLKSGGSGSIIVPKTANNSIIIPQSLTAQVQDKIFVYKVDGQNKVHYTEITVSPDNDGKSFIVTSGLKVGDKIVSAGITKLNDGMEIKPITEAQYQKKIKEAEKLGENQADAAKLKKALGM